jgi:hypothetical protein
LVASSFRACNGPGRAVRTVNLRMALTRRHPIDTPPRASAASAPV